VTSWASVLAAALLAATPGPVRLQDPVIDESSGLAVAGDLLLTVNDSGDGPVVYAVSPRTGETVGRTTYSAAPVEDVEALALGPGGEVWVGDIGDNGLDRASVYLYRLPPVRGGDRTVAATRFQMRYADGPHDAETLLVHPRTGQVWVVTKELFGGSVYRAPHPLRADRVNVLRRVAGAPRLATDGAFFPDGRHVVVRGYGAAEVLDVPDFTERASMPLPPQRQGEGVAVPARGDRLLVSSEGRHSLVEPAPLPDRVLTVVRPAGLPAATAAPQQPARPPAGRPDGADATGGSSTDWLGVVALAAVVLAVGLGVRAVLRPPGRSR
jgi:hypothetical protein